MFIYRLFYSEDGLIGSSLRISEVSLVQRVHVGGAGDLHFGNINPPAGRVAKTSTSFYDKAGNSETRNKSF